jgi:hypothetical protein
MTTDEMICTSCRKPKASLKQKKSRLLPGVPMYLCQDCLDNKREPRGYVVLAGRKHGMDHIKFWTKPQRYIGDEITIRELQ